MAGRLAKNLKEDYLCCGICLSQYHKPKTLQCDHSYCEECIKLHVTQSLGNHRNNVQPICPLCRDPIPINTRHPFDIDAWVKALPTDALLESLLNTLHLHESKATNEIRALPLLCEYHGGKPREAYCYTHAQLVCWECAARNHRQCEVESSENAHEVVQASVNSLKETVSAQLSKAKELGKIDRKFAESKTNAMSDILAFDRKLDQVYDSAKQQIALLRNDIEHCTKLHLENFKPFYEAVSYLLELNQTLEIVGQDTKNTSAVMTTLETVKQELSEANLLLQRTESVLSKDNHFVAFVKDEHLNNFLDMYSSIGFVDSNIPGSGMENITPRDVPDSIAHLLKRPAQKSAQSTATKPSRPSVTKSPQLATTKSTQSTAAKPAQRTAARPPQTTVARPPQTTVTRTPQTTVNKKVQPNVPKLAAQQSTSHAAQSTSTKPSQPPVRASLQSPRTRRQQKQAQQRSLELV